MCVCEFVFQLLLLLLLLLLIIIIIIIIITNPSTSLNTSKYVRIFERR